MVLEDAFKNMNERGNLGAKTILDGTATMIRLSEIVPHYSGNKSESSRKLILSSGKVIVFIIYCIHTPPLVY